MIYESLFERTASIVADRTVLEALGQKTLDALCAKLIEETRTNGAAHALERTIIDAGEALATTLPRADEDENELTDALILIDA